MATFLIPQRKPTLILIHGFMSDRHCWDDLRQLFSTDFRISERFETIECFEYPTALFGSGDESAQPRLRQLASALMAFLSSPRFIERELVLVGHSQGGLVIQAYLVLLLEAHQAKQLRWIRQAIFIATPNLGSVFLDRTRRLTNRILQIFTRAFLHPQERLLRALQPEIMHIQKLLLDRIVSSSPTTISDERWPVPLQCFYGTKDQIVLQMSAQSFFSPDVCTPLLAGHLDIVKPDRITDERYEKLVDALLQPTGHANVLEVARYETRLRIEPYNGLEGTTVQHGTIRRVVHTDNRAILTRTMTIASTNRCRDTCVIPYLTNPEGFVRPIPSQLIEHLGGKDRTRYEMQGREFNYPFVPQNGDTYEVSLEILKGFERGDRRIHFHLGLTHYYRTLVYILDLSEYLRSGLQITQPPRLHFEDTEEHRCEHIWNSPSYEMRHTDEAGIWQWALQNIRQGSIGLTWDLDH
ncbi:MAG: alpha/beta hydrolase [Nitrospira sp.]